MSVAIVDYGMGNVRSLTNALAYVGEDVIVTADPAELAAADRLLLPGVGAFGDAMVAMHERGLVDPLTHLAMVVRKPVLGVCLGMQLFAETSVEHGEHRGLGWLAADIAPLEPETPAKVPHVGWNSIRFATDDWLFRGVPVAQADFYFVHSLHMLCRDASDCIATTDHGGPITAVVRRDNLVATQFHPEKSQDNGIQLLQNWLDHEF
ncbi:imidazole glycerol phosphate synthase subunit HisH [Sphingopyxis sp.]|uniref:imidazole glycerol phosphate synthase subunit HisH n=1 Tax=Sphingopyxis sp. TaxID=1908224 RepID=UPI003BA9BB44